MRLHEKKQRPAIDQHELIFSPLQESAINLQRGVSLKKKKKKEIKVENESFLSPNRGG